MSNNMISVIENIFNDLKSHMNVELSNRDFGTKIIVPNEQFKDKLIDILKNAKIRIVKLSSTMGCISILYDDEYYFLYPKDIDFNGLGELINDEYYIEGFGLFAISNSFLLSYENKSYEIYNEIFASENSDFYFEDIKKFYHPYSIIKDVSHGNDFKYIQDIYRMLAIISLQNSDLIPLKFEEKFYLNLNNLLLLESSRSIANCVARCIESTLYEHCFLEMYRCIEFLFTIQISLKVQEKHHLPFDDVINLVTEREIIKREPDTLLSIFREIEELPIKEMYNFLLKSNYIDKQKMDKDGKENVDVYSVVSIYVYNIRCRIAHYSYKHSSISSEFNWGEFLIYLSNIILHIYIKMNNIIVELCEKNNDWTLIDS